MSPSSGRGLGAPCLLYLAAAGVGTLTLIDDDSIALSNLQRQVIHPTARVGDPKVESAADALQAVNPHVALIKHQTRLSSDNASNLLQGADVVVDGSDSFETRAHVAAACEILGVPLVTGAVSVWEGSLTVLAPHRTRMMATLSTLRRSFSQPSGARFLADLRGSWRDRRSDGHARHHAGHGSNQADHRCR